MSEKKISIEQIFALAVQHQQNGNSENAQVLYKKILLSQPNHWQSLSNLGILAEQSNKYNAAINFFKKAMKINPNVAKVHHNLGVVWQELGDQEQALTYFKNAWQIDPNYENNIIKISLLLGSYKLNINLINDKQSKELFLFLFKRNNINHNHIFPNAIRIIFFEINLDKIKSVINANTSILRNPTIQKLLKDELFNLILQKSIVVNRIFEHFLTKIRKEILIAINEINLNKLGINFDFIVSLAEQCFLNEYVYNQSERETKDIFLLKNSLLKNTEINELKLAILGCYMPLSTNKIIADRLLRYQSHNPLFNDLITLQIRNNFKENELAQSIKSFSEITDTISQKVKKQYEKYPYPRWRYSYKNLPLNFLDILNNKIKFNKTENRNKFINPKVLVAGCGTGQHILIVCNYHNAKILGVDLSLKSLSFAKRQTNELGIDNVEYLQADILQLNNLGKKFDVIEASGVIHHMKNPLEGLKILVDLLEPHGFLKLGLYSEIGRKHIIETRSFVKKNKFKNRIKDIRQCREKIFSLKKNNLIQKVTKLKDFYSISTVRDLIFHVKEHRFTLLQIYKILYDFKLIFLGFNDINTLVKRKFSFEFPNDKNFTSLKNWHQFETNNPNTFPEMYNFWVKKKNN